MKKILIVEDHKGLREAYKMLLERNGYEVEVANDGQLGLDKATTQTYSLILLDMLMPNMGGIEFLKKFQPLTHPETKVVVFSNLDDVMLMKESLDLGAKRYLTKAIIEPEEMLSYVREDAGVDTDKNSAEVK